jgi:hypothetical protein
MKLKIKELLNALRDKVDSVLRRLCYGLSPSERLATILSFCVIFGIASIYMTVSSIYNIGKNDAKREFLELEHIKRLELQHSNDSINFLKQKVYE